MRLATTIRVGGQLSDIPRAVREEVAGVDPTQGYSTFDWDGGQANCVTNNGSKGAWAEVKAALGDHCYGICFTDWISDVNTRDIIVDIGIGASGSEVVLINNLLMSQTAGIAYHWFNYHVPIFIPKGSRVAVRAQSTANFQNVAPLMKFMFQPMFNPAKYRSCETWGANTGDSGGVSIDPGGTANTKGAWSEIVASSSKRVRQLLLRFGAGQNSGLQAAAYQVDVGVGAAGSESLLVTDLRLWAHTSRQVITPSVYGPIPVDIPAGTRVAVRGLCSITDATDRKFDVVGYGFSE